MISGFLWNQYKVENPSQCDRTSVNRPNAPLMRYDGHGAALNHEHCFFQGRRQ